MIGGDGDKRILLEEAIEMHGLQSRVEMLGELSHSGKWYSMWDDKNPQNYTKNILCSSFH